MQMYQQPPPPQQQHQFSLQQGQQQQQQQQQQQEQQLPFDISSSPLSNATFESFLFDNNSINSDNPNDMNSIATNNDNCNNNNTAMDDSVWNFDEFIQFDIEDQNGMLQVPPLSSPPSNAAARRRSSSVNTPFPNVSCFINSLFFSFL